MDLEHVSIMNENGRRGIGVTYGKPFPRGLRTGCPQCGGTVFCLSEDAMLYRTVDVGQDGLAGIPVTTDILVDVGQNINPAVQCLGCRWFFEVGRDDWAEMKRGLKEQSRGV